MMDFRFVSSRFKRIIGIFLILLCIIVRLITPFYIEIYWFIPFLIIAIGLIVNDATQNSKILAGIGIFFGLCLIYVSIMGILDPYSRITDLYLNGILTVIPGMGDIGTCIIGNVIMVVYAIVNMICCGLFIIPTSAEVDF